MFFRLKNRLHINALLIFALQLSFLVLLGCVDKVNVSNGNSNPIGLMVDGQGSQGAINDLNFVSTNTTIGVGELSNSPQTNEVVGFTNDRPPKFINTPWTPSSDKFNLDFPSEIRIPVTVWIVKGPFADQKQHAIEACIRTSGIWHDERMGVIFSPFNIIDATGDPDAPTHYVFPNGDGVQGENNGWKPLRDNIGFIPGQLNIYWVDTVDGFTDSGWSNFGAQIAMGKNSGDELLVHEIGHAFSLEHVNVNVPPNFDIAEFDEENIMHNASDTRKYVTEGQLFRSHLNLSSILNVLYNVRPGEFTRTCNNSTITTSECPGTQKRIWADGGFQAN
ncbi:hypothetical protein MCAMS1_00743 [biofilm metagenome]